MDVLSGTAVVFFLFAILAFVIFAKTAIVVPQQSAFVVERLGRVSRHARRRLPHPRAVRGRDSLPTLAEGDSHRHPRAGLHHARQRAGRRRRRALSARCSNPERASYGISDYIFAIIQLAQTTLRSEIGKIDLDRTFEERTNINMSVVSELDKASEAWGVKVLRYEIKNITPPQDVLAAMEKQMRAEREKRAVILTSEGQRDAAINTAEGDKQQVIKASEAQAPAADQRGRRAGRGDPRGRHGDGRGHPPGRRSDSDAGRLRGHAAARRRAVHRAVRRAREGERRRWSCRRRCRTWGR